MIAAIAVAAVLSMQAPVDFSGTWTIDPSRSSASGGRGSGRGDGTGRGGGIGLGAPPDQLTIRQDAASITIEERGGGIGSRVTYTLDGRKAKNAIPSGRNAGAASETVSKWKGQRLETEITGPLAPGRPGRVTYRQVYHLDRDGALVVEISMRGSPNTRKTIYVKRAP
jgi:hypothetical protein